eukprot:gnl/MRDRNA2_/MRDRNA2_262789_c0_seq1.p1 gnl/MRDRNA2_/MRDRNA2_262789_c0~~gnl/MRDRNA2_/MRDRNA2_262789_c0_seq1.p1  ORF type:complete len:120 (-),score=26.26 gnl/MRDRNA2_/MRDRNA2_262789_c0_seq1:88-447(-)
MSGFASVLNYLDYGFLGVLLLIAGLLFITPPKKDGGLPHWLSSGQGVAAIVVVVAWAACRYIYANMSSPAWEENASCEIKLLTTKNQRNLYLDLCLIILALGEFWISKLQVQLAAAKGD